MRTKIFQSSPEADQPKPHCKPEAESVEEIEVETDSEADRLGKSFLSKIRLADKTPKPYKP